MALFGLIVEMISWDDLELESVKESVTYRLAIAFPVLFFDVLLVSLNLWVIDICLGFPRHIEYAPTAMVITIKNTMSRILFILFEF